MTMTVRLIRAAALGAVAGWTVAAACALSGCATEQHSHDVVAEQHEQVDASERQTSKVTDQEPSTIDTVETVDDELPETPASAAPATPLAEALRPELFDRPTGRQPGVTPSWSGARLAGGRHVVVQQHAQIGGARVEEHSEEHKTATATTKIASVDDHEKKADPSMPKLPFSCGAAGGIAAALVALALAGLAYYRKDLILGFLKRLIP